MSLNTTAAAPPSLPPRRRSFVKRLFLRMLLLAIVGFGVWTWAALSWAYSEGDRAGVLLKFSRKGWVCKTWEGELAQYVVAGVAPQIWIFSVRDAQVADQISKRVGENVQLHYSEHKGIPTSCFGDTPYFVERVSPVK